MHALMYATPTFITKVHHFLLHYSCFNNCYSELTPYIALDNSYWLVSMTHFNVNAMLIRDIDYSFHITVVELV